MEIGNRLPFEYYITHINLNVYRRNSSKAIGHWKLANAIDQKINAKSEIPVKIEIDNYELLSDLKFKDILNPNFDFFVKGVAEISIHGNIFTILIEERRKVTFSSNSEFNLVI